MLTLYVDYDVLRSWNVDVDWFINHSWTGLVLFKPQVRLIAKAEDVERVERYQHLQLFDALFVIYKSAQDNTAYDGQGVPKKCACLGLADLMRLLGPGGHDHNVDILVYVGPGEEDDPPWKQRLLAEGMRVGIITPRPEDAGQCESMVGRIIDFCKNPRGDGALTVYIDGRTLENRKVIADLPGFVRDVKQISPEADVRLIAEEEVAHSHMYRLKAVYLVKQSDDKIQKFYKDKGQNYASYRGQVKLHVCRGEPDEIMGRGGPGEHGDNDILVYVGPHEDDRYWKAWKQLKEDCGRIVCSIGVKKDDIGERGRILDTIRSHYVAAGVHVHDTNSLKMHCSDQCSQEIPAMETINSNLETRACRNQTCSCEPICVIGQARQV